MAASVDRVKATDADEGIDWERDHPTVPDDWAEQAELANAEHQAIAAAERFEIEQARRWEEEAAAELVDLLGRLEGDGPFSSLPPDDFDQLDRVPPIVCSTSGSRGLPSQDALDWDEYAEWASHVLAGQEGGAQ